MTTFEIILVVTLGIFALALLLLAIRGRFTIKIKKHIIEEKKIDELQLEIAKKNLEEFSKFNAQSEKAAKEQEEHIKTVAEAVQDLMGVTDDDAR